MTQPSAPSSAPSAPRGGRFALALALAAAASAWNPLGAPFALVAGAGAALLAVRALARSAPRTLPAAALVLGGAAALASVLVLLRAAGVSTSREQELQMDARSPSEQRRILDDAAARSGEARQRAAHEMGRLPGAEAGERAAPPDHRGR